MGKKLLALYVAFREPETFLKVLAAFITVAVILHFAVKFDPEWGSTNLTLSIEATIAGAVQMVLTRTLQRMQEQAAEVQRKQLEALVRMAEAERQVQADHLDLLKAIRRSDEELLRLLRHEPLGDGNAANLAG